MPTNSGFVGNHLSDPKLANVSDILTQEPFKSEWLDEQSEQIPWHKSFQKDKKYDIFNLHTIWNKTAVRYNAKICIKYRKHWKSCMGFHLPGQTGPFLAVLKKTLVADYEQLLRAVFSCFQGQKKYLKNIVASALKSCIK